MQNFNFPFRVLKFTKKNFLDSLDTEYISRERLNQSSLFKYLYNYFQYDSEINKNLKFNNGYKDGYIAKTLVVEKNYVSDSFLKDYGYYYAECFRNYRKLTHRIHFFESEFTRQDFINLILIKEGFGGDEIWNSYLGYIVVKPIPNSFIGATLIKPYKNTKQSCRYYNSVVSEKINIFGKTKTIRSLVFQQQDSAVSACATNALWSALHKTSKLFGTSLPSPGNITSSAGHYKDGGRIFPNKSLENRQISNAIHSVGLVAEMRVDEDLDNSNHSFRSIQKKLKKTIESFEIHIKSRHAPLLDITSIPSTKNESIDNLSYSESKDYISRLEELQNDLNQILIRTNICKLISQPDIERVNKIKFFLDKIEAERVRDNKNLNHEFIKRIIYAYNRMGIPVLLGYLLIEQGSNHLVCITGYRMDNEVETLKHEDDGSLILKADKIRRLFVHNDQVGPFSKVGFDEDDENILKTWWIGDSNKDAYTRTIIIPIDPSIRIKYEDVEEIVDEINLALKLQKNNLHIRNKLKEKFNYPIQWDIYIDRAVKYKKTILKNGFCDYIKSKVITTSYPKYIWLARAKVNGANVFDLVFDPTDTHGGFFLFQLNFLINDYKVLLLNAIENYLAIKKYSMTDSLEFESYAKRMRLNDKYLEFIKEAFKGEEMKYYLKPFKYYE